MRKPLRTLTALLCAVALMIGCIGCGTKEREPNKTPTPKKENEVTPTPTAEPEKKGGESRELTTSSSSAVPMRSMDEKMKSAYETFAYNLFAQTASGETRMISPFSVYVAFGMLAGGADGLTREEIDKVMGLTTEERNEYLASWIESLVKADPDDPEFTNADSVWIRNGFEEYVEADFLKLCADYFRSAVFSTAMDKGTIDDVNAWVEENTKGMIKKVLEELRPTTEMILVNAISLEAKWRDPFDSEDVEKNKDFTHEDGSVTKVDMMNGSANSIYLHNDLCTGFIKGYKNDKFSYIALLPNEGVSVDTLVKSLKAGTIEGLIATAEGCEVKVSMPQYKQEYSLNLGEMMTAMGMESAFDPNTANFAKLAKKRLYVAEAIHKTFIDVDTEGTKAAAVTAIIMDLATCAEPLPVRRIVLDRPFVYMIVDQNNLPIFIGTYE